MNATTSKCTACYPSCPDAQGFPSSCEVVQILQGKTTAGHHLSKGEHEKNMNIFALQDKIDSALYELEHYTD